MTDSSDLTAESGSLPLSFAWRTPLARELLAARAELAPFYPYRLGWADFDQACAARRRRKWSADPTALAAAWHAGPDPLTPAQQAGVARLLDAQAVVVVTGQQPGFLGGPLYTLHKALTVVGAAERLQQQGVPAVPVFWSATEDDDFAEVATAWLLDRADSLQSLTAAAEHRAGAGVGGVRLPPEAWASAREALAQWLPEGDGGAAALALLERCWGGGATLGDGFRRWLTALLGDRGLLILEPTQPAWRRLAAPFFQRVLDDPLAATRVAGEAGDRLVALGYEPAVHRTPDLCPFYLLDEQGLRQRLRYQDGRYLGSDGQRFTPADLHALAADAPERFSTSVLLRPVLQDWLLPTGAFVVGPGEAAYMAQVSSVYGVLDGVPPLLLPRWSATLLEPKVARALDTCNLSLGELSGDVDQLLAQVSRAGRGQEVSDRFAAAWSAMEPALRGAGALAAEVDGSLSGPADALVNRLRSELDKLEEKVQRSLRQQDETLRRRLSLIHAHLTPGGAPQERRLSAVNLLARYGPTAVDLLAATLAAIGEGVHTVVRWSR